jgi:hypothetical protein
MSRAKWVDQLASLKTILVDLSMNPKYRVSIIVFNTKATVFCKNREASSINVNAINFPGGGTYPGAAFGAANEIMNEYVGMMNLYYTYISDGIGPHPADEIREMLNIKKNTISNGYLFNYASILIGGTSSSVPMEIINKSLQGTSAFVSSAVQISARFKEILNTKSI